MIRLYDEQQAELLLQLYLDSVQADPDCMGQPDWKPAAGEASVTLEQRSGPSAEEGEGIYGSVRVLEYEGCLIHYLVWGFRPDGYYHAVKVSTFLDLGLETDPGFTGYGGRYIAEPDNLFPLSPEEVEDSITIDQTDLQTFMQLEGLLETQASRRNRMMRPGRARRWQERFRVREHELTCPFRSRDIEAGRARLWVSPLELLVSEERDDRVGLKASQNQFFEPMLRYSRRPPGTGEERGKAGEFDISNNLGQIHQHPDEVHIRFHYSDEDYRLNLVEGTLILEPAMHLTHRRAAIYSGDSCVFRGSLPREIVLTETASMPLDQLARKLQITIRSH